MMLRSTLLALSLLLVSCSENPRSILDSVIRGKQFIPYELPMPSTRVGTILRGSAKEMYVVARPERCFPDLNDEKALRWTQETDLPSQYKKIEFGFSANLNTILNAGSASLSLKAEATYVKTVELEFEGAQIEFLEEMNFHDYYQNSMSQTCKTLLAQHPFIGQGLRIESMKFIFKNEFGGAIDLSAKLPEIVDIDAGVKWRLANNYTLIIETPKYIGYRMATLKPSNTGVEIQYATTTDKEGNWIFRSVGSGKKDLRRALRRAKIAEPL